MKKIIYKLIAVVMAVCMLLTIAACNAEGNPLIKKAIEPRETNSWEVVSPDTDIKVSVGMDSAGNIYYSVNNGGVAVVDKSALGLDIREDDLNSLVFDKKTTRRIAGSYNNITGKHSQVEYDAMELQLTFKSWNHTLDVFIRAYDDGYAFRYKLDSINSSKTAKIDEEKSSFVIPTSSLVWRQVYKPYTDFTVIDALKNENLDTFAYERSSYDYIPASGIGQNDQIAFPVLYRPDVNEDVYSLVTESAVVGSGFYGSILQATSAGDEELRLQTVPTPAGSIEDDGYVSLPFTSPWRVGITGTLQTVVESELVEKVYDDAEYWKPDNYDELSDEEKEIYRCKYCEEKAGNSSTW